MNRTATVLAIMLASALAACANPPVAQCKVEHFGQIARVNGRLSVVNRKPAEFQCQAFELEKDPLQQIAPGIYIAKSWDRSDDKRKTQP